MEDPKPCPDCKHDADTHSTAEGHYVFCSNDQCVSRPCTRAHSSPEAAVVAWNHDETH